MEATHVKKKWQNLIRRACPKCGEKLSEIGNRRVLYECLTGGCEFVIGREKLYAILTDEGHIMRTYFTELERMELANAIRALETEGVIN